VSEVISVRLPKELTELIMKEAQLKGVSLGTLLREIVERHYGVKRGKPEEPFLMRLEKALNVLGEVKMHKCGLKEDCPLKGLGVNPSPIICALCQLHSHTAGFLETSTFNPYALG
jgi:hypothetical protein